MTAYYNEHDPNAAAWLEELIKEGHIAYGHVDRRSIVDIKPVELRGYPDPVCVLSSILARHAQEAWGNAYEAYAAIGFPLAHGARFRVTRLRGYGNAIVAEVAQTFIEAYLEGKDITLDNTDFAWS